MPGGRFVLAREVEELLGPRGLRQLETVETFTCVCGQRSRTDAEPVSVYVEVDQVEGGAPMFRARFAHARCRPSRVEQRPGLIAGVLAAAAGGHAGGAAASFQVRERPPRAVLIWSPYERGMTVSAPGQLHLDLLLKASLEAGLRPVRTALAEADLPAIEAWSMLVTSTVIRLSDLRRGAVAYEQQRDAEIEPWAKVAVEERRCLVVTGSGLADALARGDVDAIRDAERSERLVGALVRVEVGA